MLQLQVSLHERGGIYVSMPERLNYLLIIPRCVAKLVCRV